MDNEDEVVVTERDIIKFEKKYDIKVFQSSAKHNENVNDPFIHLTKEMVENDDLKNGRKSNAKLLSKKRVSYDNLKAQRPGGSFHLKRPTNETRWEDNHDSNP